MLDLAAFHCRQREHHPGAGVHVSCPQQVVQPAQGREPAVGEKLDRPCAEQGLDTRNVAGQYRELHRRRRIVVGVEPGRRALVHAAQTVAAAAAQPGEHVRAQQLVGLVALAVAIGRPHHSRDDLEVLEHRRDTVIAGHDAHELDRYGRQRATHLNDAPLPLVELREDLVHHVVGHRPVVAREIGHRRGWVRLALQRQSHQAQRRHPTLGPIHQGEGLLRTQMQRRVLEQPRGVGKGER